MAGCTSGLSQLIPYTLIVSLFFDQLQEAFAAGLIKPGLNSVVHKRDERNIANNIDGLQQKTSELAAPLKRLPWVERLDHVALKLAPLAPELALKVNYFEIHMLFHQNKFSCDARAVVFSF